MKNLSKEIPYSSKSLTRSDFIEFEKQEIDTAYPNIVYEYVKFSKIGLKIKLVFHNEKIDGLWLSYYEV